MNNIKILRFSFILVITFSQIYVLVAQTTWPPIYLENNQNFQYSNYQMTPLVINPALAGSEGLFRVSSLIGNKYNNNLRIATSQLNFSTEYTIIQGFKNQDKVGIGVSVDLIGFAGTYPLPKPLPTGINYTIGASYHYSLNTDGTDFLSFGIQHNSDSRYFVESRQNLGVYPDNFDYKNPSRSNLSAGLLYKSKNSHKGKSIGIATYRLNSILPFIPNTKNLNRYGFNAHGSYDIDLYKNFSITPGFFYSNFEFSKLLNINTNVSYWINKEKMTKVYLGIGLTDIKRTIIYAGATLKGINLSLAYEMNKTSDDHLSNFQSGLEIGASYTGFAKK